MVKSVVLKTALEMSLALNPEHVGSLKQMCAIIASEGKVAEAEVMLTKIPQTEAVDPNTLLNIGMSHYNAGEPAKALPFLDRAVSHYPDHASARYFHVWYRIRFNTRHTFPNIGYSFFAGLIQRSMLPAIDSIAASGSWSSTPP